ncbi:MAG: XRE family transcriptional regulator [Clostridia bacterium]|nr:XRE family transcriptional regulator [Clostridia bacterium]
MNISFGANLKALRKKAGYTRKELSEKIAYSEKSIEKWELGSSIPPILTVCKIAEIFGVTLDTLVCSQKTEIKYLLGIDGGGTKTEFLLTDLNRNKKERLVLGASNPIDIGIENCKSLLEQGIMQICSGIDMMEISMFAGLAGGISGENQKILNKFFSRFGFGAYSNGSDTENALETALKGEDGIAVIMGTGIIAFAQKNGKRKRIGGWGYLMDKGGSGYNLGADALSCAFKSLDGRGGSDFMRELIEKQIGKPLEKAIPDIYNNKGKAFIASFAKIVFEAYENGDSFACEIIDKNMREVADIISAGYDFLKNKNIKTVICGGLSNEAEILKPILNKYIEKNICIEFSKEPIINGAVSLAGGLINA